LVNHKIISFRPEGIYCKPGDFYIDPWKPVKRAIITHGHADHARRGMESYLCHNYTVPILKLRLGLDIKVEGLEYNEILHINGVKVSLHPAGHVIGSAQIRLEYQGNVLVITGDYKLQNDKLSTPFESIKCHEIVSESTFGLPIYHWEKVEKQEKQLQDWVTENNKNDKTSIFIGYSLGKAQRILQSLNGMGEILVHYTIANLNKAYETVGIKLPNYTPVDLREKKWTKEPQILIVPPALFDAPILKKIPNTATAICSGWMQVRGARRWRSADAGFAISDHADWDDLLTAIKSSEAEQVYVTHGQTSVFSKYLNEIGIKASEVKTSFGDEEDDSLKLENNTL
jgi:putative mRNA 3-end processing factor